MRLLTEFVKKLSSDLFLLNQGKRIFKKELIGRIYTRDELSDTEFILEDDLPISDDLAS